MRPGDTSMSDVRLPERPENKHRCSGATQFGSLCLRLQDTDTWVFISQGSLAQGPGGRTVSARPRQPRGLLAAEGMADAPGLLRN